MIQMRRHSHIRWDVSKPALAFATLNSAFFPPDFYRSPVQAQGVWVVNSTHEPHQPVFPKVLLLLWDVRAWMRFCDVIWFESSCWWGFDRTGYDRCCPEKIVASKAGSFSVVLGWFVSWCGVLGNSIAFYYRSNHLTSRLGSYKNRKAKSLGMCLHLLAYYILRKVGRGLWWRQNRPPRQSRTLI